MSLMLIIIFGSVIALAVFALAVWEEDKKKRKK
jgi:hypothetical protein